MDSGSLQKDCRVQKVVQVLNQDPSRTLPELAQSCQISSSRLSHLFKNDLGITLKSYRLECRLQEAAVILASTSMPVKEIAYAAGYHHSSSFVRAFKTHFEVSPACYRRRHLQHAA